MLTATLALSVLVGISLGMLGGGGSILTVPVLVYVAGQDPKAAIAMSLLVVGVTSAAGAVAHARAGRVDWRTGAIFGAAGMAGAYGGGRLAALVAGTWLLVAFGLMMLVTAVAMLRGGPASEPMPTDAVRLPVRRIVVHGVVVGVVTGLVGAGGGFLVVPALVLLAGMPMSMAVGTSLVVIAMKSGAGLLGYLASTTIDWRLAAGVTVAAVIGSIAGGKLTGRVSESRLRTIFAWFVAVMAVVVLAEQLPSAVLEALATARVAATTVGVIGIVVLVRIRWRRRPRGPLHRDERPARA